MWLRYYAKKKVAPVSFFHLNKTVVCVSCIQSNSLCHSIKELIDNDPVVRDAHPLGGGNARRNLWNLFKLSQTKRIENLQRKMLLPHQTINQLAESSVVAVVGYKNHVENYSKERSGRELRVRCQSERKRLHRVARINWSIQKFLRAQRSNMRIIPNHTPPTLLLMLVYRIYRRNKTLLVEESPLSKSF